MTSSNLFDEGNETLALSVPSELQSAEMNPTSNGEEGIFIDPLNLELELFSTEQELADPLLIQNQAEETILGTSSADLLTGDNTGNFIKGRNGNDTLLGLGGDDLLEGNSGDDKLKGNLGHDTLLGGQGDDYLDGGKNNDSLVGNVGDDILSGKAGDDILQGRGGEDLLIGGNDNDSLFGGDDKDMLRGQLGDDLLSGGQGDDLILGQGGEDLIRGNQGNDWILGGEGNDTLNGGENNDSINGDKGDDRVLGAEGNDTLEGGRGDDTLRGDNSGVAEGSDIFVLGRKDGRDIITDFQVGQDKIGLKQNLAFADLIVSQHGTSAILSIANTEEEIAILRGVDSRDLTIDDFIEDFDRDDLPTDTLAPTVTASLAEDTGIDDSDGISSTVTIVGTATDDNEVSAFTASIGDNLLDVTDTLQADGSFTLNAEILAQLNDNNPLEDGEYTIRLKATDAAGNESSVVNLPFTLDTTAPEIDITEPLDSQEIEAGDRLIGTVNEALASFSYRFGDDGTEISLTLDDSGAFDSEVDLEGIPEGLQEITFMAVDTAGNETDSNLTVDVVTDSGGVDPINLDVMPGERLELSLFDIFAGSSASTTFALETEEEILPTGMLEGDGTLIFNPNAEELGSYSFTIIATDGETVTRQDFVLEVAADPITTTRISGVIQNTDGEGLGGLTVNIGTVEGVTAEDGSFTLEFPGELPDNFLRIGAGQQSNGVVYPNISEELSLVLGHEVYDNYNNVIDRPIYLPAIDTENAVTIDPTADTTVTTEAIPGAEVFVAAGSLEMPDGTPFTGDLSITEVPRELTPANLPENLFPDTVVTIQPGEMVFTTPAPLSLPNRAGYAPGTEMNLWSINPETGDFDDVGTGVVSADGSVIETISGGIRNSSWHFFNPPPGERDPEDERTPDDECDECKETAAGTSLVELHSGAVIETHNLVTYQSLGENRGVTLTYDSQRADPRPIVNFGYRNVLPRNNNRLVGLLTIKRGNFEYRVPGASIEDSGLSNDVHFWSLPEGGGEVDAALQADIRTLSSGRYNYQLSSGIFSSQQPFPNLPPVFGGTSNIEEGDFLHVNSIGSVFGNGWGIEGLIELVENPDGSVLMIDGDGEEILFEALEDGSYDSPPGDFTVLEKLPDGTFRRTTTDQTIYSFNQANQIVSMTDRVGNQTQYLYNTDGNVSQIIDPVGLETTFNYTDGLVTEIVDPAGRTTVLGYDDAGNLVSVTDPDNTTRTWDYDDDFHMTLEIDKRGNEETTFYDLAGRADSSIKKDGETIDYDPVQVQGLYEPDATLDPINSPVAFQLGEVETEYIDANGNVITTLLDQSGQALSTVDEVGNLGGVERDEENLITQNLDAKGNLTTYEYDAFGNVTEVTDIIPVSGSTITSDFDASNYEIFSPLVPWTIAQAEAELRGGNLVTINSEAENQFLVDTFGTERRWIGFTDQDVEGEFRWASGEPVTFLGWVLDEPNNFGGNEDYTVLNEHFPGGWGDLNNSNSRPAIFEYDPDLELTNTYTYDSTFNQLTSSTDELGHQTLYEIDVNNGNTLSVTEVIGEVGGDDDLVSTFTYTSNGLIDLATDPLGRITDYDYDEFGRLEQITFAVGTTDEATRSFEYDAAGNQTAIIDENGNRTEFEYDELNRLEKITEVDPDGDGELTAPVTSFDFDENGNLISTTDALNNVTTNTYDVLDRLETSTDELSQTTTYTYDSLGNILTVTDPLTNTTTNVYDERNRLVESIDPDQGVTKFGYDLNNNLVSVIDPEENETKFEYDAIDRLVREIDPLEEVTTYEYDAADNLVAQTDRNSRRTEFAYDDLDRLIGENWIGSEQAVTYTYNKASNLVSTTDIYSSLTYSYDSRNRAISVDNLGTSNAPNVVLDYAYDGVGNMLSVTDTIDDVASGTNNYSYDGLNRLSDLTQSGNGVSDKRVDFAYNSLGQFTSINRYSNLTGTQLVTGSTYGYDEINRLSSITHNNGTTDTAFYDYAYDDSSRITQITDVDGVTDYSYDKRSQLTGAARTDVNTPDETYTYDANGNRISSSIHGDGYVTGDNNRLTSDGTYNYEYDNEGNLIRQTDIATGEIQELEWDYRNRLVALVDKDTARDETQRVEFTYDAFDRRISKTVDTTPNDGMEGITTHFVYSEDDVHLEFIDADGVSGDDAPELSQRYLHGAVVDQVLAQEDDSGETLWMLTDHLGTVRDLISNTGVILNHISYDSFGNVIAETDSSVDTRYLFTGREYDEEIGLYYYRARYYDAEVGRFISEDPIGFAGNDFNIFRYVGNNSINFSDPTGLHRIGSREFQFCMVACIQREVRNFFGFEVPPVVNAPGVIPIPILGTVLDVITLTIPFRCKSECEQAKETPTPEPKQCTPTPEPTSPTNDLNRDNPIKNIFDNFDNLLPPQTLSPTPRPTPVPQPIGETFGDIQNNFQ